MVCVMSGVRLESGTESGGNNPDQQRAGVTGLQGQIMNIETTLAQQFRSLFSGMQKAYGTYGPLTQTRGDGKLTGRPLTKREPVIDELYQRHLEGKGDGLGIIVIREDDTCLFGAVDIDQYSELDHGKIASQIAQLDLPLLVCRSKSGGTHLFLFCQQPVLAGKMQARLREIAARLGFGNSEIFPKQTQTTEKDLGSWINLPYFGGAETTRYAVGPKGEVCSLEDFLVSATAMRQGPEFFEEPKMAAGTQGCKDDSVGARLLPSGPPCLQHLVNLGLPDGTWNTSIFNIGVYCRKAHTTGWKEQLVHINSSIFDPTVWSVGDLNGVMKSLDKKSYAYTCNQQPLLGFCDKAKCSRRKFGVKSEGLSMPAITGLTKYDTNPPRYVLYVDGIGVEVARDELFDYTKFEKICSGKINRMLPSLKVAEWKMMLNEALETLHTEVMPEEASPEGQLWLLVEHFCTGRTQAQTKEEILLGKPWTDMGFTMFRLSDLMNYLQKMNFRELKSQNVATILRTKGGTIQNPRIGGKQPSVWTVPAFARTEETFPVADAVDTAGREF